GFEVSARARVNASAGLLRKAESIFRRAKKLATSPDERLWASGHVHFCIALMASWRAIDGTASSEFERAASNFDDAGKNYYEAGYLKAAEDATARRNLVQASNLLSKTNKMMDQEKRKVLLESALKMIQESSVSLDRATDPNAKRLARSLSERAI